MSFVSRIYNSVVASRHPRGTQYISGYRWIPQPQESFNERLSMPYLLIHPYKQPSNRKDATRLDRPCRQMQRTQSTPVANVARWETR